jgi:hypothetical protein
MGKCLNIHRNLTMTVVKQYAQVAPMFSDGNKMPVVSTGNASCILKPVMHWVYDELKPTRHHHRRRQLSS